MYIYSYIHICEYEYIYVNMNIYIYDHTCTSGRTKTHEQWLLLESRAKNWEAGGLE